MQRLTRSSLYNLLGQGIPFLAAVVAIPLLITGLGTDRFGVLTLAWMVTGYFSLFDLGLGRALTQVVAERIGADHEAPAPDVVWPALALMTALGAVASILAVGVAPLLVHSVLKIPPELQGETLVAFDLLAAAVPVVVVTAGVIGVLTGYHRFGVINAIRAPLGIYTFVAPLIVLPYSRTLPWVIGVLVAGRSVALVAYWLAMRRHLPARSGWLRFQALRPLLRFGAWMTVTNTVSPLLQYLDRFVVGAMVSMAAVAYYATPYEAVTKALIVPGAVLGALFPAFAASHRDDPSRLGWLFTRGTAAVALVLFPALLLVVLFAREGLTLWLGSAFAAESTTVLQVLAIGVFINGVAQIFATLVQGVGRPDLGAKLHLIELPLYLPALWWAIRRFGIIGAAYAWTGRVALDAVLLFVITERLLDTHGPERRRMGAGLLFAVAGLVVAAVVTAR